MYVNSTVLCGLQHEELDYGCSKTEFLCSGNIQYWDMFWGEGGEDFDSQQVALNLSRE